LIEDRCRQDGISFEQFMIQRISIASRIATTYAPHHRRRHTHW
jgi:hypothetical protein